LAFCCHSAVYAPCGLLSTLPVTALFTHLPSRGLLGNWVSGVTEFSEARHGKGKSGDPGAQGLQPFL
jgi:hypothetical protein